MPRNKIKYSQPNDELGQTVVARTWMQTVKDRFIHMCFVYSEHRFNPAFFAGLLIVVAHLQVFAQLLDERWVPRSDSEWGPFKFVGTLLDLGRITPFVESGSGTAERLAFVYCTLGASILYTASFYYMHYSMSIKKLYFILPISLASLYGTLLLWVLVLPVCEVYVLVYSCRSDGTSRLLPGTICWSAEHVVHTVIITFGLALQVVAAFLVAVFFNDSRRSTTAGDDALARLDTNAEVFFCSFRVLAGLFGRWLLDQNFSWVLLLLHAIQAVYACYHYYRYIPYYNSLISAIYGACVVSHCWEVLHIVLYSLLGGGIAGSEDRKYKGVAIIISVGMGFAFVWARRVRGALVKRRVIEVHHAMIGSDEELDLYVQSLMQLYDRQLVSGADELILRGLVGRHKAECMDPDCPLLRPAEDRLYHPLTATESGPDKGNVKDKVVILALINSIFHERERRLGDQAGACLHLIYSTFLYKQMGNIHMAIVEIMRAQKASPTSQQEVSIYYLLRSIEEFLVKKYHRKGPEKPASADDPKEGRGIVQDKIETLDVTIVIKFENWLVQLFKVIEKCAGEHIEFWSHLESILPDLNELNRIGLNILQSTRSIADIWRKITKINPNHPKALNIYGYYLRDIKNDSIVGQDYIEKAMEINAHKSVADEINNEFDLMFAEDTAIIVVNGSPECLGKIVKTNSGVFKLFGYNPYEIYGNDISILMPNLFAQYHSRFMHRYFETGRQYLIQNERMLFALHRNNYVFCISLVLKPVPALSSAIPNYIGLMRQVQKEFDFILTDKHGKVDAISMGIYHTYNITANFIKDNQVYIHLICPELADPSFDKHQQLKLKFDRLRGRHKLTFIVPRDFTTLAHLFSQTARDTVELAHVISVPQSQEEADMRDKPQTSSQFFNFTYKIYKSKHKEQPFDASRKNIVRETFDYLKCDVQTHATCDVSFLAFAGGMMELKVFKIYRAKVIKRKNSIEDYATKDDPAPKTGRQPQQVARKNSQFDPNTRRHEGSQPKRSCTGVRTDVDNETSPRLSQRQDSDQSKNAEMSPSTRSPIPKCNESFHMMAEQTIPESKDSKEKKSEEKKQSQQASTSSGRKLHFKLHPANETVTNSTPDPKGLSMSGASEGVSNAEEDRRPKPAKEQKKTSEDSAIIKIIDTRQMEVAKRLLVRKRTQVEGAPEEPPKPDTPPKPEGESPETTKENKSVDATSEDRRKNKEEKKKVDLETGSVATTTHNLLRILQSLQGALSERYSPPAIGQLKCLACLVLLVLLALTIVCYLMSIKVYSVLDTQLSLATAARQRGSSIANIAGYTRLLVLIDCEPSQPCLTVPTFNSSQTQNNLNYTFQEEPIAYTDWVAANLGAFAATLKDSQDTLSNAEQSYASERADRINPSAIATRNLGQRRNFTVSLLNSHSSYCVPLFSTSLSYSRFQISTLFLFPCHLLQLRVMAKSGIRAHSPNLNINQ